MSTTRCPHCDAHRWTIREHQSFVLHVDVDLDGRRIERTWADTSKAAVLDATCDACGHVGGGDLLHALGAATEELRATIE